MIAENRARARANQTRHSKRKPPLISDRLIKNAPNEFVSGGELFAKTPRIANSCHRRDRWFPVCAAMTRKRRICNRSWSGPDNALHDFRFRAVSVCRFRGEGAMGAAVLLYEYFHFNGNDFSTGESDVWVDTPTRQGSSLFLRLCDFCLILFLVFVLVRFLFSCFYVCEVFFTLLLLNVAYTF